ncbi:indole-3-glycerol phosphate synthase TrpC [Brevibacillus dissolubilis]|uniref:indole-3-glycerol phosphate synthase TrpC n=1 Tax=Brevibacillus dissolubilis TaxID=1844116 RepID=UPI0011168180|nr:indole-3-glycerol phosphate synthase TrpC [Brevibacillus dissolubilis]
MLHKIVETKKQEVAQLKAATRAEDFLNQIKTMPDTLGFRNALINSARPVSVIAEVKKASPSKGIIREQFDPVEIAKAYAAAQADAMSVLTDQQYFQGNLEYLRQIRQAVQIPLIRKDFLIDELQVLEARAAGADCILLIAAILDGNELHHLNQVAESVGLDVLIEVHDTEELETVLNSTTPKLLGVNNRNLKTFQTDIATTQQLITQVPADIPLVSESGISSASDITYLHSIGARSVLVGEHFMRQDDIAQAVIDLVGEKPAANQTQEVR